MYAKCVSLNLFKMVANESTINKILANVNLYIKVFHERLCILTDIVCIEVLIVTLYYHLFCFLDYQVTSIIKKNMNKTFPVKSRHALTTYFR